MFRTGYASLDLTLLIPASQHGINEDLGPHTGKTIEKRRFEAFDPYTPNVIRNLKDKSQPVRDDRHYAPGTVAGRIHPTCVVCQQRGQACQLHAGKRIFDLSSR